MIALRVRFERKRRALSMWFILAVTSVAAPSMAGVNEWTSIGPEGGNVSVFAIDPTMPSIVYAGAGHGVFKSANGGMSWESFSSGLPNAGVVSLAIDASGPTVLYAGTSGLGLYKTTDGGTSWSYSGTGMPFFTAVTAIVIDPSAPSTLYVGSFTGAFKSTNGGMTWDAINAGLTDTRVIGLTLDPTAPSTLYACTYGGLFKSTNAGASWDVFSTELTNAVVLVVDPTSSSTLYVGTRNGVFKSTNSGTTWDPINVGLTTTKVVSALEIDPIAPNVLYLGTVVGGVFKSTNGGASWEPSGTGLTNPYVDAVAIDPTMPSRLYVGSERGAFKSTNSGETWAAINTGLTATQVLAMAIDPLAPSTIYASASTRLFKTTSAGETWELAHSGLPDGDAFVLAVDSVMPTTLYAGGVGVFRSTNGGTSWQPANTGLPNNGIVSALVIDPTSPNTLYAGTWEWGAFKSTNAGLNWVPINIGLTNAQVVALALDPMTPSTLYAGTNDGVFKSTNAGASWDASSAGLAPYVDALVIHPTSTSTLYAGTNGSGVFKSVDAGANWNPVNTGLTDRAVNALAIDPTTPSRLYAGTTFDGVFKSANGGESWAPVGAGLPRTVVTTLAIDPTSPNTIYAGTLGGGVLRLDQVATGGESVSGMVDAGGSCSTDAEGTNGTPDGTTAADPIETTIVTPNAGLCAISEQPATVSPVSGYLLVGYDMTLTAPPASSANDPLQIIFDLHPSVIPPGQTVYSLQLLKDGVPVPRCDGAGAIASPDPCLLRVPLATGGARLIVYTTTASVWSPVVATLDSYLCYGTAATKGAPAPALAPGHLFTDAFGTTRFDLGKPGDLCLPAARDGAAITDGTTALQAAAVKAGKVCSDAGLACTKKPDCAAPATCGKQPKFTARTGLRVFNALGPLVVDATKPAAALLPSAVVANPPEGVPNPELDPFTCYAVKPRTKVCVGDPTRACTNDAACGDAGPCFAAFPKDLTVRLDEPTATPGGKVFAVKKPTKLCLPAELDGRPRMVPSVALQCYALAPAKKQCANTATLNAGASCKQEEDCGGQKNATSFCQAQAKHAPAVALPVTGTVLGALTRDTKKEAEICVPSEAMLP